MRGEEGKYETKKNRGETREGGRERGRGQGAMERQSHFGGVARQALIRSSRLAVHRDKKPVLV